VSARTSRFSAVLRLAPVAAMAVALVVFAGTAAASTEVLTKAGTLYEVFPTTYGTVAGAAAGPDADLPVLALRTTPSGGTPSVQAIAGTVDPDLEGSGSLDFDEDTQTLFVIYTKEQSLLTSVYISVLRDGAWTERPLLPTTGFTLATNPKIAITRQPYIDVSPTDPSSYVMKWRSILSVIWWEEGSLSQAKYSALFIEDGVLNLDAITSYSLNDLAGQTGPTSSAGLSPNSYSFPALQRSYKGDGSVLVSFANLFTQKQAVLSITFPNAPAPGPGLAGPILYSRHRPVGLMLSEAGMPQGGGFETAMSIGTVISPGGSSTFWWLNATGTQVNVLAGSTPTAMPLVIPIRPDFSVDRALAVVREMAEKE
jgi:hypothetical protein